LRDAAQKLLLDAGQVVGLAQVHMIPDRLLLSSFRGSGHQAGEHRAPVPFGEGPLAFGQMARLMAARTRECPTTKRYAAPEGRRDMGVNELDEPQLLGQGIKQGRGSKLPGLHGLELGELGGLGEEMNWARIAP